MKLIGVSEFGQLLYRIEKIDEIPRGYWYQALIIDEDDRFSMSTGAEGIKNFLRLLMEKEEYTERQALSFCQIYVADNFYVPIDEVLFVDNPNKDKPSERSN